jgi:hypothetical protein
VARIICFTSDFGTSDGWVGVCHAVAYERCADVRVVDLAHDVAPFDVGRAAAVAAAGAWQLPQAVHLVVVDPDVGGPRRDLVVVAESGTVLVGPDNGVLLPAAQRLGGIKAAYAIVPARLGTPEPLPTFHARDVLMPAAASLACGADAHALGEPCDPETLTPPPFAPARLEGDALRAEVVDIDRYGSVRVAVTEADLGRLGDRPRAVQIGFGHSHVDVPYGRTFADVPEGEAVALIDSSGWLTLAVRKGSAAERYGVECGIAAQVRAVR